MKVPWDIDTVTIVATKHFATGWMRILGWNVPMLRDAICGAYKIEKVGKKKFEMYIQKSGYKKIISVYFEADKKLLCITGSQGGKRL